MNESNQKLVRDYAIAVTIAVVIALLVRFFLIEAYRLPSQAMKPTLLAGDTIFVAKWPFGLRLPGTAKAFTQSRLPRRGEVVIFSSPSEPDREYIKRVIALPGEEVEIRSGMVLINDEALEVFNSQGPAAKAAHCAAERLPASAADSRALEHGVCWEPPALEDLAPTLIPEDSVFLIGDLRSSGEGPRRQTRGESWGVIPLSSVKGSALWVWLSVEPRSIESDWLPRFRFERMFRRIE